MPSQVYNSFKYAVMSGGMNLSTDVIKIALTNGYTPDIDNDVTFANVTNEVTGTGYTTGGKVLDNKLITQNNTNDSSVLDADDITWAASVITADGAVIYNETYNNQLIGFIDFGSPKSSTGSSFTIVWNNNGILNIQ